MSWSGWLRSHQLNIHCFPPSTPTTHLKSGFIMAQKNGLEAIGAVVCREFGADGFFDGTIIGLSFTNDGDSLYRVKYTDGAQKTWSRRSIVTPTQCIFNGRGGLPWKWRTSGVTLITQMIHSPRTPTNQRRCTIVSFYVPLQDDEHF